MILLFKTHAENSQCSYKEGYLNECSPLAMSYTPLQQSCEPTFTTNEALARGTLFPGLELPFMNMINNVPTNPTPLEELMAIDFVTNELCLYLDTHKDDAEAFQMYKDFLILSKEGRARYSAMYGPICQSDMINCSEYTWIQSPWPWEYRDDSEVL